MVAFTDKHKTTRSKTSIDWYNELGQTGQINLTLLSTADLWAVRRSVETFCAEQLSHIDAELNDWSTISCSVCGEEDLAYRGEPFVTWGIRGGYILCPRHLRAFDRRGTPEQAIIDKAREEEAELKEIFG